MDDAAEEGWRYVGISEPEKSRHLLRHVGVLYVRECPSEKVYGVGGCFCVYESGNAAIFMTAAHVITEAARRAAPNRLKHKPMEMWTSSDHARVQRRMSVFRGDLPFDPLPVLDGYRCSQETDLAAFVVDFPRGTPSQPGRVIEIDSDTHPPGTRIVTAAVSGIAPVEVDKLKYQIDPELQLRFGKVTVIRRKGRLVKTPVYETSIPFLPGMSGSPVFPVDSAGKVLFKAIGIVSSDFSTDAAHSCTGTIGCSSVIPVVWAYGLGSLGNVSGEPATFEALCKTAAITDVGKNRRSIKVTRSGDDFTVVVQPRE